MCVRAHICVCGFYLKAKEADFLPSIFLVGVLVWELDIENKLSQACLFSQAF